MARVRMTLDQVAISDDADRTKIAATTDADIRRLRLARRAGGRASVEKNAVRPSQTVIDRLCGRRQLHCLGPAGEAIEVDAASVEGHVGDLADNADWSRFIL